MEITSKNLKQVMEDLSKPFPGDEIQWRIGAGGSKAKPGETFKAMVLAYITARSAMNRLDEVVGAENWQNRLEVTPKGEYIASVSIKIDGEWVTKTDGASGTDVETVKGGISDAFKRACVLWGIGRYLYGAPKTFVTATKKANGAVIMQSTPELPDSLLPEEERGKGKKKPLSSKISDGYQKTLYLRAGAYTVPENPIGDTGKTLLEASTPVKQYLAGQSINGDKFKPNGKDEIALSKASEYVLRYQESYENDSAEDDE